MTPNEPIDRDIDELIEPFEAARGRGDDRDLSAFLPPPSDPRFSAVLLELIRVDMEFAWDQGRGIRLEVYRERFPDVLGVPENLQAIVWEEFRLRRAAGESPTIAEYQVRFGIDLSEHLARLDATAEGLTGADLLTLESSVASTGSGPSITGNGPAGRYELLEELARGGMGTVFRARDLALDRDVAVKVLRGGATGQSEARRRFLDEGRIAGQLQHPGIPAVHDRGSLADGRPFLAMRLVDGQTLAALLAQRSSPNDDRGRFIAIFEQVCQAIGYAHSRGIVHRDLKPSNIMVGRFGEVQVMDWGLAKERCGTIDDAPGTGTIAEADSRDTQAGSIFGTPAYMAPEQARGEMAEVDGRADVFGLGALLCEILTGQPPYTGPSAAVVAAMAARADLAASQSRLDGCAADRDLVDLCKRCLAAEPSDRPRTGGEVATAIAAMRAATEERARRAEVDSARAQAEAIGEQKRRRVQVALVVSLVILGTGGGLTFQAFQQIRDKRRSEAEVRRQDDEQQKMASSRGALAAIEQAYRDMDEGRRASARDNVARATDRLGARTDLPDVAAQIEAAQRNLAMSFALEDARLQRAGRRAGLNRFDHERTITAYEAAFDRFGLPVLRMSAAEAATQIKDSHISAALVVALDEWSALVPESSTREHLRSVAKTADTDPWRTRLRDLWAQRDAAGLARLARESDTLAQPPATIHLLAMLLPDRERIELLRAAIAIHPTDFWISHNLGVALLHQGPSGAAEAVGPLTAAVALRPQSPGARVNLASALIRKGDPQSAVVTCRAAIKLDPNDAGIHQNLGVALRRLGDAPGAVTAYREAIRLDPTDPRSHTNLGVALEGLGDRIRAIASYREAIRLNPADALAHLNLGGICRSAGDRTGAIAYWQEAARLNPADARSRLNIGSTFRELGELARAEVACREAIRLDPKNPLAHTTLGSILRDQRDLEGAVAAHREAIRLAPNEFVYHFNLGNALCDGGDGTGAAAAYRAAVRIDPNQPRGHIGLGHALLDVGDLDGAVAAYRTAVQIDSTDPRTVLYLVNALTRKGELARAVEELRNAPDSPVIRSATARAEQRLAMSKVIPDLASGRATPSTAAEALAAAEVSLLPGHQQFGLAYRLYSDVISTEADVPVLPTRYDAAGAAVQLASGRDRGRQVDASESARLYEQARAWLREAMSADPDPWSMRRRLADPAFAPVREPAGLAALPPMERVEWERLWTELARRTDRPASADGIRPRSPMDDTEYHHPG